MSNKTGAAQFRVHFLCTAQHGRTPDPFLGKFDVTCDTVADAIAQVRQHLQKQYGKESRIVIGKTKILRDAQSYKPHVVVK